MKGECRRALDEVEEVDPDVEDAWFQGEDGDHDTDEGDTEEEKEQEVMQAEMTAEEAAMIKQNPPP
eukprot:11360323-Prorocentrum_lima.AAC.1